MTACTRYWVEVVVGALGLFGFCWSFAAIVVLAVQR
jgi:hypothetical protein